MIVLPAIDLKDGTCVRLKKGEFHTAHRVADSALETAKGFSHAGARWIHMVDLDGARNGIRKNFPIIEEIITQSGLHVELGGGMKTKDDLLQAMEAGASRAVIGSAAVSDPGLVEWAVTAYGGKIAVGIDCLDGRVRTAGWELDSGLNYLEFAAAMQDKGVKYIVFTDIATDGMESGPSFDQLALLQKAAPKCRIIASGGVTTVDDVKRLRDMGIYGAIIGKAYYSGAIDLAEAVQAGGDQNAG